MSANNQVILIGRAGNNPGEDIRHLQSGSKVAELRLAVNRPGKDQNGQQVTDWIQCQFWNKQAEIMAQYVSKGDLISVAGSVRVDSWEKDGEKRMKYFIHGENFQMLESRKAKDERNGQAGGKYGGQMAPMPGSPMAAQGYSAPAKPVAQVDSDFALDDDELPPF